MLAGFDRCRVVLLFLLLCCPMVDVGREGGKNLPLEDQWESRGRGKCTKKYTDKFFKILECLRFLSGYCCFSFGCLVALFFRALMPVTSRQEHVFILVHYYCFPGFCAYVLSHGPTSVSCLLCLGWSLHYKFTVPALQDQQKLLLSCWLALGQHFVVTV